MARKNLAECLEALVTMSPVQLHEHWHAVIGEAPPQVAPALLRRLIAQRMQEKRGGSLPASVRRRLLAIANGQNVVTPQSNPVVNDGTRFIREWQGRTIEVVAVDGGFEWEGRRYGSLSRIAREVTGAHQSGPRFFGLTGSGGHG